jgi:hypothetical protein
LETRDLSIESAERVRELRALHQRTVSHSSNRFRNARSHDPPQLPFAIGSKSFSLEPEIGGGWTESRHPARYRLACEKPPCAEIEIGFPMPDGQYTLTLGYVGSGQLRVDGSPEADWFEIGPASPAPSPDMLRRPWNYDLESSTYGGITVDNRRFSARLRVVGGAGLSLQYLGFIPEGASVGEEQSLYEERLKALGYVQ